MEPIRAAAHTQPALADLTSRSRNLARRPQKRGGDSGPDGLRRPRSVRKYPDRLTRARAAAATAPAHQYQPPSVTAATIKPAASTIPMLASAVATTGETLNPRCERIWPKHHEGNARTSDGWSAPRPASMIACQALREYRVMMGAARLSASLQSKGPHAVRPGVLRGSQVQCAGVPSSAQCQQSTRSQPQSAAATLLSSASRSCDVEERAANAQGLIHCRRLLYQQVAGHLERLTGGASGVGRLLQTLQRRAAWEQTLVRSALD